MISIRKYRKACNMTQEEVAEKLGVSSSCIAQWETGTRKPNIIMLKKLSKVFQCSTDELLETVQVEKGTQ